MADINRFTEKAQEALTGAQRRATRSGNPQVDVEHVLSALLDDENGLTTAVLHKAAADTNGLKRRLDDELNRLPRVSGTASDSAQISGRLN